MTLYAKWEAVQTVYHTVTFNSNGGIFDDGSELREVTQVAGTKFTVPAAISRDGYILASYSNPHGTLNPGTEYDIDLLDGHTFYADWTPLNHTVSFVTLGGSALDDQSVATGGKVIKPEDPTKEGYVFSGWYSDAELTSEYDFNSPVTEDITLYAKWNDESTCIVKFETNGGSEIPEQVIKVNTNAIKPAQTVKIIICFFSGFQLR